MGSGSAATINMWYDRDIDAIMKRTQKRPIVTGAVEADEALGLGIVLGFFSVLIMALCINLLSAFILLLTIFYYIFIYTIWLKRSSPQNVVIGGVSGALPPIIGWTAVTGSISIEALVLFMIIFLWTPPHSWALALFRLEDYKSCLVPMMPVAKGELSTKKQMLVYSILMVISSTMPYVFNMTGKFYMATALILDVGFLYLSIAIFKDKKHKIAKQLFIYSILYLFIIFLLLIGSAFYTKNLI
jgi:protoheme IX farnesyltransferase